MEDLNGRVAVVTGAASGIGRATAAAFAAEGMKVVLSDIEEKALDDFAGELSQAGHTVVPVVTDVSDGASMDALADRSFSEFGAVHVLHLNAGVGAGGPMWTLTEKDWQWVLGVNLWGVIHGVRAFVGRMVESGEPGHVVNTASMAGLGSGANMGPYNVSKHGVVTLSETLYRDLRLAKSAVSVSVLCPGWVQTGIGASGRNRPDDLRDGDSDPMKAIGGGTLNPLIASGLPPDEIAAAVVDAVRNDRFYILTHAGSKESVKVRFDDIMEGRQPTMPVATA